MGRELGPALRASVEDADKFRAEIREAVAEAATVTGPHDDRRYLAWCGYHSDGIRTGRKTHAIRWANQHNEQQHTKEIKP